jgi:hypothetical protein
MTEQGKADVTESVDIAADADAVYRLITDLPTMAEVAAETTSMAWVQGDGARPGATFKGTNSNGGKSWTTKCTVTAADPGKVFAFDVRSAVIPVAHWRYDIVSTGEGACHREHLGPPPRMVPHPRGVGDRRERPNGRKRRAHHPNAAAPQGEGGKQGLVRASRDPVGDHGDR